MAYKIITIGRQYGCNGRVVGKSLSQSLGIEYYDRELIDMIACKCGFAPGFVEQNCEYSSSGTFGYIPDSHAGLAAAAADQTLLTPSDHLQLGLSDTIRSLADREARFVIVGRGADFVLRHRHDVLRVFLYADEPSRIQTLIDRGETTSAEKAADLIAKRDRARRKNYKHYTGRTWGDPNNYHLCLNTGLLGVERCIRIIAKIFSGNPIQD